MNSTVKAFLIGAVIMTGGCASHEPEIVEAPDRSNLIEILGRSDNINPWDNIGVDAPDEGCVKLQLRWTGPLRSEFNDSNHVHLESARQLGFKPITKEHDILNLRRPIIRVESCPEFYVEPPSHSYPYLVPEAHALLVEIGRRFNDTLMVRGGGSYRLKVTSLLRTPSTVRRLSRVNNNATSESTHSYGTTFDISYSKFICDDDAGTHRTFEDLKNLLGEILHDLRNEGRCYVKYEVKQSCFHITTHLASVATED